MTNQQSNERAAPVPILVIDNNQTAADALGYLLNLWGYQAEVAYDGEQGLALALRLRPACVLLDLDMPGMDGFEVARRLRADPSLAKLRIVALSGYNEKVYRELAEQAGFDQYLVKALDSEQIKAALADLD